ncbi:hypothetical protein LBMAG53_34130 [Planctomycetota bacterium]|nr:hypothetical protein LBMAG53_34130 [Planctomycetota bacterium]
MIIDVGLPGKKMTPEIAYNYRSFEHYKRETFPIIANVLAGLHGNLHILDLACGPAVFEGIAQVIVGGRITKAWLLDHEIEFLEYAKMQLNGVIPTIQTWQFDMNDPASFPPDVEDLAAVISVNALFHAKRESLHSIYAFSHKSLRDGGVLINHQTFGGQSAKIVDSYCAFMDSKAIMDPLDKELMRRSQIDTKHAGGPVNSGGGGGYKGLNMDASEHIEILRSIGFEAGEIWRKGKSAIIMAIKKP